MTPSAIPRVWLITLTPHHKLRHTLAPRCGGPPSGGTRPRRPGLASWHTRYPVPVIVYGITYLPSIWLFSRSQAVPIALLQVLRRPTGASLTHSAGGSERNWSTHIFIFSDRRQRQTTEVLGRNVRTYRNMRLRDHAAKRGIKAKKQGEPKEYPLHKGDWSSCDESSDGESADIAVRATMGF